MNTQVYSSLWLHLDGHLQPQCVHWNTTNISCSRSSPQPRIGTWFQGIHNHSMLKSIYITHCCFICRYHCYHRLYHLRCVSTRYTLIHHSHKVSSSHRPTKQTELYDRCYNKNDACMLCYFASHVLLVIYDNALLYFTPKFVQIMRNEEAHVLSYICIFSR